MPFVEISRKRIFKGNMFPDYVYVSARWLKFSEEFWQKELNSAPNLRLFFNEETNQVGMVPSFTGEGYKIKAQKRRFTPSVNWRAFLIQAKLSFEKISSFKVEHKGSANEMRTFTVVNGIKK